MRKGTVIGLVIGVAAVFAICGGVTLGNIVASGDPKNDHPAFVENTRTSESSSVAPIKKTNSKAIGEGQWIVGVDVDPGNYRTKGAQEGLVQYCVWSVRKNDNPSAEVMDFGSADKVDQPGLVTLKDGQYFTMAGCQDFVRR
jgi:hypothetical protein